jgi:hypothetical protein
MIDNNHEIICASNDDINARQQQEVAGIRNKN